MICFSTKLEQQSGLIIFPECTFIFFFYFAIQSNIRLKFGSWFKRLILHVPNRIEIMLVIYVCSNGNLKHVARAQQFYSAKQCDVYIKSAERVNSSRLKLVFDSVHVKCDV